MAPYDHIGHDGISLERAVPRIRLPIDRALDQFDRDNVPDVRTLYALLGHIDATTATLQAQRNVLADLLEREAFVRAIYRQFIRAGGRTQRDFRRFLPRCCDGEPIRIFGPRSNRLRLVVNNLEAKKPNHRLRVGVPMPDESA